VIHPIPTTTPTDLRDRALILLGFSGAFRRSELVGIDVEHIRHVREGIIIQLGGAKTDQEGHGHTVTIPKGRVLRPVAALDAWLAEADVTSGPVFRQIGKGGRLKTGRLSAWAANEIIRSRFAVAIWTGVDCSGRIYGPAIYADQAEQLSWMERKEP
jgi:site-specific recombinase XerC